MIPGRQKMKVANVVPPQMAPPREKDLIGSRKWKKSQQKEKRVQNGPFVQEPNGDYGGC